MQTFNDFVGELKATYRRTDKPTIKIKSSIDLEKFIRPYFEHFMDDHEEVKIIHLNTNGMIVNLHHHSVGGLSQATVDFKLILRQALLIHTASIILVHNHPSGNLKPSEIDIEMSKKLKKGCKAVGLILLDSIIITRESYLSLADQGIL